MLRRMSGFAVGSRRAAAAAMDWPSPGPDRSHVRGDPALELSSTAPRRTRLLDGKASFFGTL